MTERKRTKLEMMLENDLRDLNIEWVPEVHFDKPRRMWRLDFQIYNGSIPAMIDGRLFGVEVHGGTFAVTGGKPCPVCKRTAVGGHNREAGMAEDFRKQARAQALGWVVYCFTNKQVETGEAAATIARALGSKMDILIQRGRGLKLFKGPDQTVPEKPKRTQAPRTNRRVRR